MIFVPGLPTEPGQEIFAQELLWLCHTFVFSHKTGNTQTAIYGHLVTYPFNVPFKLYIEPITTQNRIKHIEINVGKIFEKIL